MTINITEISDYEAMELMGTMARVKVLKNMVKNDTYVTKKDICNIFGWEYRVDKDD